MKLAALQQDFEGWLVTGSEDAAARFAPEAQAGLLVYQNNYRASLMACLEESFAQTLAYIGGEAFAALAAQHIDARPPNSWSLDHYAAHFPAALAEALPDDPEVAELAALELALAEAFVGPDGAALTLAQLPEVDWDQAVLRWVPSARLLAMATNGPAIWSALTAEHQPEQAIILPEPATVIIWRQDETACFRTLDPLEAELAPALLDAMAFADLCARLISQLGEAEGVQTAGALLGRWVAEGLLVLV